MKTEILVLDSAPIFKSASLLCELSSEFITVPEVLQEIKDQATRDAIARLPYKITTKSPSEESISYSKQSLILVIQFAKKTGDYSSLSITDIKVLALTLQLEWERVGRDHLRSEPYSKVNEKQSTQEPKVPIENGEKKKNRRKRKPKKDVIELATEGVAQLDVVDQDKRKDLESISEEVEPVLDVELVEHDADIVSVETVGCESSDDGGEWITPSNVSKKKALEGLDSSCVEVGDDPASTLKVACVTNDFAMQNVLIQIKLRLLSVDGLLITKLKTWVLRCHACFKTTSILDKSFCPSCGNATLMRTSVGVDQNGNVKLFLKKNFQYRNRGTVYSIPAPKGGRKSAELILREDQKEHQMALKMQKRYEKKVLNQDTLNLESMLFGEAGARLNAAAKPVIGHGRKNPNASKGRRK